MGNPRFLADKTVGRLAKWLRLLGVDCASLNDAPPVELLSRAANEGRVLLTKSTALAAAATSQDHLHVTASLLSEQLKQVVKKYGLTFECKRFLSICSVCNSPLDDVAPETVRGAVPPYVFATRRTFRRCPACGRVYWAGTHKSRMLDRLKGMLDISNGSGAD
jgi:uncharacterized protein with PIN domain